MKSLFFSTVLLSLGSFACIAADARAQGGLPTLKRTQREIDKMWREIEEELVKHTVPLSEENKIAPTIEAVRHESAARMTFRIRDVRNFRWTDDEFHTDEAENSWHAALRNSLWVFHADGTFTGVLCRKNFEGEEFPIIRGGYQREGHELRLRVAKANAMGGTTSSTNWDAVFPIEGNDTLGRLSWDGAETAGWSVNGWQGGYALAAGIECRLVITRE